MLFSTNHLEAKNKYACNFLTDLEFGKRTFFKVYNEKIAPRLPHNSIS